MIIVFKSFNRPVKENNAILDKNLIAILPAICYFNI